MRKYTYIGLLFLFCAGRASAQFTLVSGTVTDVNSVAYACGAISASIVNQNGQSLYLNGVQFSPSPSATKLGCQTDPSTSRTPGAFSVQVADNTQIKCGSGASIVTCAIQTQWLFTVNTTGIPPPGGTGPQTCTATLTISGSTQTITALQACPALSTVVSAPPLNTVNPSSSTFAGGAKYDAHFTGQPTFTNTSNIVTCPQNDCNFLGTDLQNRPIAKVGQIVFGGNATTDVSQTTSGFITPECVIQSIDSASQIHMGQLGAPATPCNATATTNASGYLWWGDLDTASSTQTQSASNDPYFAAWQQLLTNCGTQYQLPAGNSLVERGEWNNNIAINACNANSVPQLTRQGYTIQGAGKASSIMILTPNFVAADCNPGCFGQGISDPNIQDFQIWGGGNSNPGAGFNNKSFFYVFGNTINGGTNFSIRSVIMQGFGSQTTGLVGLDIGHNVAQAISGGLIADSIFEALGAVDCENQPGTPTEMTQVTNSQFTGCGIGIANGGCLSVIQGQWSSSNTFYGWAPTSFTNENAAACGICKFDGDYFPYQQAPGTSDISTGGSGSVVKISQTFINAFTAGAFALSYVTQGTFLASQSTITAVTAVDAIDCGGGNAVCNFDDLGGNTISGLVSPGASSVFVWSGPGDGNIVRGVCTGTATSSSTLGLYGTGSNETLSTCTSTTIGNGVVMTKPGTILGMVVTATNTGSTVTSGVVTVLKNGVATTNTCTVGNALTVCKDLTHTVAFVTGDLISVQFTTQAAETLAGVKATVIGN